jgi:hypothetical protein
VTAELLLGLVGAWIVGETIATGLAELGRAIRAAHRRLTTQENQNMPRFRLAAVVLVAGVAVGAACASEADENPLTGEPVGEEPAADDEPVTNSANEENPPTADVAITRCDGGDFGLAEAGLLITNNSSKPSTYSIVIEFVVGGVRYGEGYAGSHSVAPGQAVELDALGGEDLRPETECRVTQVERFAS